MEYLGSAPFVSMLFLFVGFIAAFNSSYLSVSFFEALRNATTFFNSLASISVLLPNSSQRDKNKERTPPTVLE
jgi:hypothetical protein